MNSQLTYEPSEAVLSRFGFERFFNMPGMFQTNYLNGYLSMLTIHFDGVSLSQTNEEEEDDIDNLNRFYRFRDIPIVNDTELLFFLNKIFCN